jgi:hypothetical protein
MIDGWAACRNSGASFYSKRADFELLNRAIRAPPGITEENVRRSCLQTLQIPEIL